MKYSCIFLLFVFGWMILSCGGGAVEGADDLADSAMYIPRTDLARVTSLTSVTGKTWIVHQTPMLDSSLVNVVVDVVGMSEDTISIDFGETDPVLQLLLDDLDKDNYQELYIITRSPGPEAFGTLYGLYSHRDSLAVLISFEGATPYTMKEGEPYDGYRGHDQFRIEGGKLTNTIPVFLSNDNDETPTGGKRTILYELIKGPAAVRLKPASRN